MTGMDSGVVMDEDTVITIGVDDVVPMAATWLPSRYWCKWLRQIREYPQKPSREICRILVFLELNGPTNGSEVTRQLGHSQGNSVRQFDKLERLGLTTHEVDYNSGRAGNRKGGGIPAKVHRLTKKGRGFVRMLNHWYGVDEAERDRLIAATRSVVL